MAHPNAPLLRRTLAAVGCVLTFLLGARDSHAQVADLKVRLADADTAVIARVCSLTAAFETTSAGDVIIVSRASLCGAEVLKGHWSPELTFRIEGGTVGDITLQLSHLPLLHEGERALFLLTPAENEPGVYRLSNGGFGYFEMMGKYWTDYALTLAVSSQELREAARLSTP